MRAEVTLRDGGKASLAGLLVVNRERLAALADDAIADLVRKGYMELVCLHWQSVQRFPELAAQDAAAHSVGGSAA